MQVFNYNQLFPAIPSFGMPAYFSLERAAVPYFGVKVCYNILLHILFGMTEAGTLYIQYMKISITS